MRKLLAILAVCVLPLFAGAQSNLLKNPGFEYDPLGVNNSFPGWTPFGPTYGPNLDTNVWSESGAAAHGGAKYIEVSPDLTTYKINFSGLYQDYMSGPGATYSADGWVYTPSTNLLAGQNSAWIEVTFRDANANVLALYRSSIVTNLAAGGFPQNTWLDLPVTNQWDPNTSRPTNSVSTLVAPAGACFVRCQVVVRGDGNAADGGLLYFDDLRLASFGGTACGGWNLVWSDEFNGTNVDANTWTYDIGTGASQGPSGWGNNELEYYTSRTNNVFEGGGLLHILAQHESYLGSDFTSARVKSQGLFSQMYGRLEWRAKLPAGLGCWPALWLLGTNITTIPWPGCGEIDMMESRGSDPTTVQASLHSGSDETGIYQFTSGPETNDAAAFHTYTMDWSTNAMMFYVDGHLYEIQTNWSSSVGNFPVPFNQPFFFIMNLAIGGSYLGWPSEAAITGGTSFPAEMDVDYLRIYQLTNMALVALPSPPPSQPPAPNSVLVVFDSGATNEVTPSPTNGLYWNNVLIAQGGGGVVSINGSSQPMLLVNAANANSGMTLAITNLTGWNSSAGPAWADYAGTCGYPAVLGDIPSTALSGGMLLNGSISVTISGLNPGSTYNVLIYGATVDASGGSYTDWGNAQSNTLIAGTSPSPASVRFNAFYNATTVGTWTNVTPNARGQIAFTITVPSGGSGGALNFLEVTPTGSASANPPPAPTGLGASAGNGQVALTWTASPGATGYNLKRSTTSEAETTITNVTSVNYTDKQVSNGITYYYKVSAVNASGESPNSTEVRATPQTQLQQQGSASTVLVNFSSDDPTDDSVTSPDSNGLFWNNVDSASDGNPSFSLNGSIAPLPLVNTVNGRPGWTLAVTNLPGGYNYNGGAGSHYYDFSGPYPSALSNFPSTALKSAMAVGSTGVSMTLAGLSSGRTYHVLLYGACSTSTANYGSGGFQTDTLTVGSSGSSSAVHFNSLANSSTVVAWENITPGTGGRIAFTIVPDASNGGGDVNFLQVAEESPPIVQITNSFHGNLLNLSWPAGQGWRLVSQTDRLSAGLNPNPAAWSTVPGSADGNYSNLPNLTNPTVFYRLVNP